MEDESTTEELDSPKVPEDDFDLSAEDNKGDDPKDSTDDEGTDKVDDPASKKSDAKEAKAEDKAPAFDADLDEWAEKTGHDKPETDRERKLLQDLRNSRRDFTRERQAEKNATDLAKKIKDTRPKPEDDDVIADPLEKEVKRLDTELKQERATRLQAEYFQQQKDKGTPITSEELDMIETILKEEAATDPQGFEYLADPRRIGKLHREARARLTESGDSTAEAVEKAKQEERERLAKISKSGATTKSAKSTVPAGKKDELQELWTSDL